LAASLVFVGIVIGFLNLRLEPGNLLAERSRERPNWLPWLSWLITSFAAVFYIVLDFLG
jgi:hypothetical protein